MKFIVIPRIENPSQYLIADDDTGGWLTKDQAEAACAILNAEQPELTEEEIQLLKTFKPPFSLITNPEIQTEHFITDSFGRPLNICDDVVLDKMVCKALNQVYANKKPSKG